LRVNNFKEKIIFKIISIFKNFQIEHFYGGFLEEGKFGNFGNFEIFEEKKIFLKFLVLWRLLLAPCLNRLIWMD